MPALLLRLTPHLGLAALLTIAVLGLALKLQGGRVAALQGKLALETALHETDIANFRAAQAKSNADHLARIGQLTATYGRMKDEADRQTDRLAGDFSARVLRLPPAAADPRRADAAAMSGADGAARADDTVLLARGDADLRDQYRATAGGA